jgi:hypothetical protein
LLRLQATRAAIRDQMEGRRMGIRVLMMVMVIVYLLLNALYRVVNIVDLLGHLGPVDSLLGV